MQDGGATLASGVGEPQAERISVTREGREGKVAEELVEEAAVQALGPSGEPERVPSVIAGHAEHEKPDRTIAFRGDEVYITRLP